MEPRRDGLQRDGLPTIRGVKMAFLVLVALPALGTQAADGDNATTRTVVTIKGKLIYRTAHVRDIWVLVTPGGGPVYKLPGQPLDSESNPIPAASSIQVDCEVAADSPVRCLHVSGAVVVKAAGPVPSVGVDFKILVMVVGLTGSCRVPPVPVNKVVAAYRQTGGFIGFMRGCSYGRTTINPTAFKVITVTIPCSAQTKACGEDAVAEGARAEAVKQLGAVAVASYNQYSYVMPNIPDACDWLGLAELPGRQTWYAASDKGIFDKGTVMQELLHNLGLFHGWKAGVEYGDKSTSMGDGPSCPSAPELWRLGWVTPLATLTQTELAVTELLTYELPAINFGPNGVVIKIQPQWLGAAYTKNLYLALRLKMGVDADLLAEFDGVINVHELNKNIDNNYRAPGDPRVTILGTIAPQKSMNLQAYRLIVTTGDMYDDEAGKTLMTVNICRYARSANDCPKP